MGDVNLEIKLSNLDERVIKIEESGGGSGGDGYITSVSNDFNVVNKKLSLSNDVTTKLSKVDTTDNLSVELAKKINKPANATDGQVLTYNGTSNEWEAQDSKGGSITEPTDLEKGIIGGDKWTAKSYTTGSTVIYNNKIYSCIADCGASNPPTDTTYWEEISLSALKGRMANSNLPHKLLFSDTGWIAPNIYSNRVVILDGGYIIKDGFCYINIRFKANTSMSANSTYTVFNGLPKPQKICPLKAVTYSTSDEGLWLPIACAIASNGELKYKSSESFSSGSFSVIDFYKISE